MSTGSAASIDDVIQVCAKALAKDLKVGKRGESLRQAAEFMEIAPVSVLSILKQIGREARRKKPNDALLSAYMYMFENGLQTLRFQLERGQEWAAAVMDDVCETIQFIADHQQIEPAILMQLLNAFIEAGIQPGDELTGLLGEAVLSASDEIADMPDPGDISSLFAEVLKESGGNPFEAQQGIAQLSQALPAQLRVISLPQLITAEDAVLRDTGALHLLDPSPEVRQAFREALAAHTSPRYISADTLRRIIALRNWLPEQERAALDDVIKHARQRGVECAAWPDGKIEQIQISCVDGAGARSIFIILKQARKFTLASVLLKEGVGVPDAWCLRGASKPQIREILEQIEEETPSHKGSADAARELIAHHLAVGHEAGKMPPVGLLDVLETAGMGTVNPEALSPDDLIARLESEIEPEKMSAGAVKAVLKDSADWIDRLSFLKCWFEDDALVEEVLRKKSRAKMPGKTKAIMETVLESRRGKWTERFLWTALWLKEQDGPWRDFFLVGRELHRGRALADIPVMKNMAELTVELHEEIRF